MIEGRALIELIIASVAIILIPGPSVMFVIARAVAWGRVTAVLTALGNALGMLLLSVFIAIGLGPLLQRSDFITLHVPAIDGKPVIGAAEFAMMKKGAAIVNCARGGVIDETALLAALDNQQIAFAGLDVFDNEPTPASAILNHPKISLTPHIGAATNEAQERIGVELASLIIDFFNMLN